MTMHLMRGLTSLNTRKPTIKLTKAKLVDLKDRYSKHNQLLKSLGQRQITFDQFIDYVYGRAGKVTKASAVKLPTVTDEVYRRQTAYHPSLVTTGGSDACTKRESMKYTGTLVKGIATMHKSNAVPVFDDQQAKDISRMRRG